LQQNDYREWFVVEAERDPAVAPSDAFAHAGYRHLRELMDQSSSQHNMADVSLGSPSISAHYSAQWHSKLLPRHLAILSRFPF
jgi:hypothetical protein